MIAAQLIALAALTPTVALADGESPKSIIAIVGDAIRFNIGQDGYCGKRTEVERPTNAQFKIPSQAKTFFFVRATINTELATHYCEGDFSFTPEPSKLHIIRYSMEGGQCRLSIFSSPAGGTPQPIPFEREAKRSCLLQ